MRTGCAPAPPVLSFDLLFLLSTLKERKFIDIR